MPDITMCAGEGCPKKPMCHRATATPDPKRQSYFVVAPHNDGECEHYWESDHASRIRAAIEKEPRSE